jgi:hypothetical protein
VNESILAGKTQHLNFHGNLIVSILIADVADARESEQPDGAAAESHLLTDLVSAMDKNAVEATGESIRMGRSTRAWEVAGYASVGSRCQPKVLSELRG